MESQYDCDDNIKVYFLILDSSQWKTEEYTDRGIVEPRPRNEVNRLLFHTHNIHQISRWENETYALKGVIIEG